MCGIAGIYYYAPNRLVQERDLHAMGAALAHRGPDSDGQWTDGNVGLAHRRLSILDLSERGKQPFCSADGRYVITYNGEIYNFAEFRTELTAKGYVLRTSTDTEVLLYLFAEYGPAMLHRLNGMFAFAIWDNVQRELFLCRDRMGVKPLYYIKNEDGIMFASEPKALFAAGVPFELDPARWDEFLLYRFVSGGNTLFKDIHKLLPGHYAYVTSGTFRTFRWWNLAAQASKHEVIRKPEEWFENTFHESLRYRMVSDVPVGILLSGGLDSSSALASLHHQQYQVATFNVSFSDARHDESALARHLANSFGYPCHSLSIEGADLFQTLEDSSWYNDEPLVHHNDPHLLAISRTAKQHVSVLLSGEGADELMAGYVRYRPMRYRALFPFIQKLLPYLPRMSEPARMDKLRRYLELGNSDEALLLNASNLFPEDFRRAGLDAINQHCPYRKQVLSEAKDLYPGQALRQLLYLDQHTYLCSLLDRNDRSTMGASIECREPFLDYRLVEGLAVLPTKWFDRGSKGKYILKHTIGKLLPDSILNHRKVGLSVPWVDYLAHEPVFADHLTEMSRCEVFKTGILSQIDLPKLLSDFQRDPVHHGVLVQQLFIIYIWYRTYSSRIKQFAI